MQRRERRERAEGNLDVFDSNCGDQVHVGQSQLPAYQGNVRSQRKDEMTWRGHWAIGCQGVREMEGRATVIG